MSGKMEVSDQQRRSDAGTKRKPMGLVKCHKGIAKILGRDSRRGRVSI